MAASVAEVFLMKYFGRMKRTQWLMAHSRAKTRLTRHWLCSGEPFPCFQIIKYREVPMQTCHSSLGLQFPIQWEQ
jgi:hypothetical protein